MGYFGSIDRQGEQGGLNCLLICARYKIQQPRQRVGGQSKVRFDLAVQTNRRTLGRKVWMCANPSQGIFVAGLGSGRLGVTPLKEFGKPPTPRRKRLSEEPNRSFLHLLFVLFHQDHRTDRGGCRTTPGPWDRSHHFGVRSPLCPNEPISPHLRHS